MDPRPYQVEILEKAKHENTIVCLGTGTGKTFISVMLIGEKQNKTRRKFDNGGKRTFFLVNTGLYIVAAHFLYFKKRNFYQTKFCNFTMFFQIWKILFHILSINESCKTLLL